MSSRTLIERLPSSRETKDEMSELIRTFLIPLQNSKCVHMIMALLTVLNSDDCEDSVRSMNKMTVNLLRIYLMDNSSQPDMDLHQTSGTDRILGPALGLKI